jgi:hypothetical protein
MSLPEARFVFLRATPSLPDRVNQEAPIQAKIATSKKKIHRNSLITPFGIFSHALRGGRIKPQSRSMSKPNDIHCLLVA